MTISDIKIVDNKSFLDKMKIKAWKHQILLDKINNKEINFNSIIENLDGELYAMNIEILGHKNFDYIDENNKPKYGIVRQYKIENKFAIWNPINMKRITIVVNGKPIEFVRCQD